MRFRVLGPVSVEGVPLSALMLRRLLAALLARANAALSADELVAALWGDAPPAAARKTLQVYVRRLRLALGDVRIVHEPSGYRIVDVWLDASEFARLVELGRYEEALALWRGPAYADVREYPPLADEARRLDEERLRVEALLAARWLAEGRHDFVISRLSGVVEAHPFREDLRGHLMLALYRAGRQSEALDLYMGTRKLLAEELGVDPGPELQRLHTAILQRSASLDLALAKPFELPADIPGFVGRDGEMSALESMLNDGAPVVISAIAGSAGVGKTALAVHWSRRVAERFPDGQLYLNLNGFSPSPPMRPIEALASMLRSIGVAPEKVPVEESEAAALFRSQMAGRKMLLVLDNAHSAEQVRPLLPGGSGTLVLVTSRNSLGGLVAREGARRLSLDVLTPEEALSLLTQLLGPSRVAASPSAVADLARACAYLPLALRVAAASLLDRPHRSVASHVSALLSRGPLDALAIEDDPSTAVRAAFDQSYQDIPADVQRTFRLLGLIPGPDFTVEAVAALADLSHAQADRHLSRLATAHLITQIGPDRYAFHDLLRAYATERAAADPVSATSATHRLYDWYLSHVYAAADLLYPAYIRLPMPAEDLGYQCRWESSQEAVSWLDMEDQNLVAAVENAGRRGLSEYSWLLAGVLRGYFARRRHLETWLTAALAALHAAQTYGDSRAQSSAQLTLAQTYQVMGRYELAREHLLLATRLSHAAGWRQMEAACIGNMGGVLYEIGSMEEAETHCRRSLQLKREIGWKRGEPSALGNIAYIAFRAGRLTEAADLMKEAARASEVAGLKEIQSACLADLGEIFIELGRYEEAMSHLEAALRRKAEVCDRVGTALALVEMARVHLIRGSADEAKSIVSRAYALAVELRSSQVEAMSTILDASVDAAQGRLDGAVTKFMRAADLAHGFSGSRYPQVLAALGLADVHCTKGDHGQAQEYARRALESSRAAGFGVLEGRALTAECRIKFEAGMCRDALALAYAALDCHRTTGYAHGERETIRLIELAGE